MNRRRRRLTVTLSAVTALASFGGAFGLAFTGGGAGSVEAVALDAAVLSPRRSPALLHDLVAQTRLSSRLALFARTLPPDACVAVAAGTAQVFARNQDQPLTPASALKVTTAAAFLAEVGGTGSFVTAVRGPKPSSAGVVAGDVTLVGGGDPLLATDGYVRTRRHPPEPNTELDDLAEALRAAGVRRVTGRLLVADARFDDERRVPTWSNGYTSNGDVGPLGALALNDGFASYSPSLVVAPDPAVAVGQALRDALTARGVSVEGGVARGAASGNEIARVESVAYKEVVAEMLRESDNNSAELLLKELAYATGSRPATRSAGAAARVAALRRLGVAADAVQAVDGSGLDRSNKASCAALLATLTTKPGGIDIEQLLAVAGESGTLNDRFLDSRLKGVLRAKTGSLNNVTALVGVADASLRMPVRFAFVANGAFSDAGGKALQDRLVTTLATYPEAPDAAKLRP
ncbi:MAG: D-alanyl-D-alanine carboxypeptidase [Acidimicrobiales bacterium]|nr:D-alanyl-D-alanine carboxypeptidase [Acidimicrobiales bacterium]